MSDAHPVTTREQLDALRLGSLGYPLRDDDLVPVVVYRRLEDAALLLLGSDVSVRTGCIDVLDLREKTWMVSEEFERGDHGRMPWDSLPRDVEDAVRAAMRPPKPHAPPRQHATAPRPRPGSTGRSSTGSGARNSPRR